MNNYLKICLTIYITMSSIDKSNNLEGNTKEPDFGDETLNNFFKEQDQKIQNEILSYPKKEVQIGILKKMISNNYNEKYKRITDQEREQLDKFKLRDRILYIERLKIPEIKVRPDSPEGPPPEEKYYSPHSPEEGPQQKLYSPHSPEEGPNQKKISSERTLSTFPSSPVMPGPEEKKILDDLYNKLTPKTRISLDGNKEEYKYEVLRRYKKKLDKHGTIDNLMVNKTAIIVPFRDLEKDHSRTKQLNQFVQYMNDYLKDIDFKIFVVEQQNDGKKFNRGQLLNIGFAVAENEGYTNFIFHDVDLLPSKELKEYYDGVDASKAIHIAAVWDRYGSNPDYFGGIVAFDELMFDKINGYPNNFWGWGGEDDELYKRMKDANYLIYKPTKGTIKDLENMQLQQKLDYLRENDLKFMQKYEALNKHEKTWEDNGVKQIIITGINKFIDRKTSCGPHCEKIIAKLIYDDSKFQGKIFRPEEMKLPKNKSLQEEVEEVVDGDMKAAPQEMFDQDIEEKQDKSTLPPQQAFDRLVNIYYTLNRSNPAINYELEVKFGTKGIKQFTKNDYDNVVRTLKSLGFVTSNPQGDFSLRANCRFLDSVTGKFKTSDVRTEIYGLSNIEEYCKNNDIKSIYKNSPGSVNFMHKKPYFTPEKMKVRPVDFDDFNFRVSLQTEEKAKVGIQNYILENWRKSKKEFRYLNRVTFTHPDFPVNVDISISKMGNKGKDSRGFYGIIPVYTLEDSNIFNNPESYEIEIEINNNIVGPGTNFKTPSEILASLRKAIKYVLSGLQGTMYPISYPEQEQILREYMKMIWQDEYEPSRKIRSMNFIGPNSITLQLTNVAPIDENTNIPNIRKDFVVTDKADGERHLMYIANDGKIYFISTNMDVKFTGAKTTFEECFNTIIDGELISHNKKGKFINLYASFDIYYLKKRDVRSYPFLPKDTDEDFYKSRYYLLDHISKNIKPISIMDNSKPSTGKETLAEIMAKIKNSIASPIKYEMKKFFPMSKKQTIFEGCKTILQKEKQGLYEYETDGLIFTHAHYGVGSNVIDKAGPKTKITWEYSFKWKPPQYNTIDFLVTTLKESNGNEVIKSIYEDGISASSSVQYNEYKVIELRCGFNEKTDGFINPCQNIIDDELPEYKPRFEEKQAEDYVPKRFYPTEPYNPNAGIANMMLKLDESGAKQMYTESGEVFGDNTIVEFSYDPDIGDNWGWKPLRVRYDKTSKLMRGEREYGNSYKVCNENWKSIHPSGRITEDMLMTGLGIPSVSVSEDVYYNTPAGKMKTEALKNFHNLYVKKMLISGAAKQGDTLIDFACGKAGDLSKWIAAKVSFVFGVDYSKDNLENRLDGACVRYLKSRKINKHVPYALFAHGNSAFNIKDGSALLNDRAKQIAAAVFGNGPKDSEKIGRGVARQYGKGDNGFNVSSCQFAMHYFFETPDTLKGFLRNVAECTKLGGYFIGTSYDGKLMFKELIKIKTGESVQLVDDGKKIWEVIKGYGADAFEDNSSSIGYRIDVFQESINQYISEYLVNYDYFDRLMESYGFKIIDREEAQEMGLPEGTGLFGELFINMLDEIKKNKFKEKIFGEAPNMTSYEKKISFLNRYFVYKKIREVNVEKLNLELGEYEEAIVQREKEETQKAVVVAKEEIKKTKPRVKKLSKKLLLVGATEAVDEPPTKAIEEKIEKKKTKGKAKKLLIIESDEED